jgi:hypothetical protein
MIEPGFVSLLSERKNVMNNKALWDSVKVTDPLAVKPITGKSYKGNSPKPYWLIEHATETFGPIGIGWGVVVKSERFERLSDTDVLHVAVVSVWYVLNGKRSETFDQMGGTKAAYMTSKGSLMVDEDAGKKSVTDGMVKCLSMIGFAGDIFSGQWDDSKYVAWADQQYAAKEAYPEKNIKIGAKDGIGDDLPSEWKTYLSDLAGQLTNWTIKQGNPKKAKEVLAEAIATDDLDGDMLIWLDRQLDSKVRTAMRNA